MHQCTHIHHHAAGAVIEDSFLGAVFAKLNWLLEGNKNDGRKGDKQEEKEA